MADNDPTPATADAGMPAGDAQTEPVEPSQAAPARGTRRFWIATGIGGVTLAGVSGGHSPQETAGAPRNVATVAQFPFVISHRRWPARKTN